MSAAADREAGKLKRLLKRPVKRLFGSVGFDITHIRSPWPRDFREPEVDLCEKVAPYTMSSPEGIVVLADAVRHVVNRGVPGAIVECGVWKGGSMMVIAHTLIELGRSDIDLYLFDTFEGMVEPTEKDAHWSGRPADALLAEEMNREESLIWARAPLDQVKAAMRSVSYPPGRIHFVKGRVEQTVPVQAPEQIALLRLDTDWYESTKHELAHLYPRLAPGGVLIIDDYGWWRGAGEATDEYFRENAPAPFLVRIDDGGVRVAVKPSTE
jgi:O-methyltransferase